MRNASVSVLKPSGILAASTVNSLIEDIQKCINNKVEDVLIDLSDIHFIDSAGLGALVSMQTRLRLAKARMYICAPNDQAQQLFDIAGMDSVFDIYPNQAVFYAAFRRIG